MTYQCATEHHDECPESKVDKYVCSCPCHLKIDGRGQKSRTKKRAEREAAERA